MTVKYFALLTNLGAAKLANAAALGTQLQITQMAVGDGGGVLPTPNPAQTQLLGEKRRAALNSLSIDEANSSQIIAEQVIPETDGGWWIREVGLFDKDGILIAIANCPDTYKPQLQEGSGRTQTVRMVLIVSSTEAVTLKIDPSVVLATRKYVDDKAIEVKQYADNLLTEHEKSRNHLDASKTEKGFVKLSSSTISDSEILAATPKAVKTVAENATKALGDHGKEANPHGQYLQIKKFLSEIKDDGPEAVAETILNLQLRESFSGVVGLSRNARMSVVAASSSATFTADELIVETSAGQQYRISAFNKTINLATAGAGGMDTGTVPTSGFIALYAIVNSTSGATALLAVNATTILAPEIYGGANMPAGFTASALVSVWRVASGQFTVGEMMGRKINTTELPLVTASSIVSTLTELSVSGVIPKNAKTMEGWGLINSTAAATNNSFGVSSRPYPLGFKTQGNNNSGVSSVFSNLMIAEPQKIYYQIGFGGTPVPSTIYSTGYTF
ncbi:phage tail protein [Yersinia enterocolitica]